MANFPPFPPSTSSVAAAAPPPGGGEDHDRKAKLVQLVLNLTNIQLRQNALFQLCEMAMVEFYEDLPPLVWNSFGTVAALLQEIVSVYRKLSPKQLKLEQSTRVIHTLLIFQGLASHPETRMLFLNANMPFYLYPFIDIPPSKSSPLEDLRIASLSVVAALMKPHNTDVIAFLLKSEMVSHCIRSIDKGSLRSKVIATLILLRLLRDNGGLHYICTTIERFYAVASVLTSNLTVLARAPSAILVGEQQGILLMHTIRCYFQLSQDPRACAVLQSCLPNMLRDGTFSNFFRDNPQPRVFLKQLLQKVHGISPLVRQAGVGYHHMLMK